MILSDICNKSIENEKIQDRCLSKSCSEQFSSTEFALSNQLFLALAFHDKWGLFKAVDDGSRWSGALVAPNTILAIKIKKYGLLES